MESSFTATAISSVVELGGLGLVAYVAITEMRLIRAELREAFASFSAVATANGVQLAILLERSNQED